MSKKHYEAIADILASLDYNDYRTAQYIAEKLSDFFATDNPKFERTRFLQACGIVE